MATHGSLATETRRVHFLKVTAQNFYQLKIGRFLQASLRNHPKKPLEIIGLPNAYATFDARCGVEKGAECNRIEIFRRLLSVFAKFPT